MLRFLIIVLLFSACAEKDLTMLDEAEKQKPYVNETYEISLALVDSIASFYYSGEKMELHPQTAAININENRIYIIDRFLYAILAFELDTFSDQSECIDYIPKPKGKGPDEFILPFDFIYDENRDLYYISDLMNYCIYVYDADFSEIDRIKLPIRPFRIAHSENYLFITIYDMAYGDKAVYAIDLNDRENHYGLFSPSNIGTRLEKEKRDRIMIAPIDDKDEHFFFTKSYPNFNIYEFKEEKIGRVFTSPSLVGIKLPKPELVIRENDRRLSAVLAFSDIHYEEDMLFVLSTLGWSEKLQIGRYIIIFDRDGNTLCEHKISPYDGGENIIRFDSQNDVLYYFRFGQIRKYKLER
jgi:hypothetical protein